MPSMTAHRQSIVDLRSRLEEVLIAVKPCADAVDRINELGNRRYAGEAQLRALRSHPPQDQAPEDEKIAWRQQIEDLTAQVGTWDAEIHRLHAPFEAAATEVRSFMGELRRVLGGLPVRPRALQDIRAEIGKLWLWENVHKVSRPLAMRATGDDLPIVGERLEELLQYLPKGAGARRVRRFPPAAEATGEEVSEIPRPPAPAAPAELLTAKELEEWLRIDVKTIYSYVQRGLLPYVKMQSNVRFRRAEILKWMEERQHRPGGRPPRS